LRDFSIPPRCRCELLSSAILRSVEWYRGADKSLARPTSPCTLFDRESISFDASLVIYIYIYINTNNIPPIMIISRIYEKPKLLSL